MSVDQIMATLPTSEQVLSITKRLKANQQQRYDTPMEEDKEWKAYERRLVFVIKIFKIKRNKIFNLNCSQAPPLLSPAHMMEDEHLYAFKPIEPPLEPQLPLPQISVPPTFHQPPVHHPEIHEMATEMHEIQAPPPIFFQNGGGVAAALNLSRRSACSDDEEAAAPQLPLKLRHKGHFGGAVGTETVPATTFTLSGIKREKEKVAASPPWDGDSDERDSGICVNWAAAAVPENRGGAGQLKSQLARLEEEIVTIKHMMILSGGGGATAAAQ